MSSLPIGDYALLSDCRSAALVSRHGSVDWLCFPRFDGPSVFARLLDHEAGHFSVRVAGATEVTRRYLDGTMVLETTFRTPTGTAVLLDAMAVGRNDRGHELGAGSPGALLRRSPVPRARSRSRSPTRPGPSTASSIRCSAGSTAGCPPAAGRTCCCSPARSGWISTARP
jgi:Domain of unknown function (DUF5911)